MVQKGVSFHKRPKISEDGYRPKSGFRKVLHRENRHKLKEGLRQIMDNLNRAQEE